MSVDDFYLSALFHEEEQVVNQDLLVSDEKYAEELQLQEAIIASLITAQMSTDPSFSSSSAAAVADASIDQEVAKCDEEPVEEDDAAKETGESSKRACAIFVERKEDKEMFHGIAKLNEPTDDQDNAGTYVAKETGESSKRLSDTCVETKENEVMFQETAKLNEEQMEDYDDDADPFAATETGESSKTVCEICVERKEDEEMFQIEKCFHSFCNDCISKHVVTKIQDSKNVVLCPSLDCESEIEIESCRSVIPHDLVSWWDEILCESLLVASQKYYCPFKDCSALLVNDSEEVIKESVCPVCHRLFCAQCHTSWHPGIECEEFQKLNEDEKGREDLIAMELAKDKRWQRCSHCRFYVERNEGCLHMTCRCGFQFCYACGETWTSTHGGCQR